MLHLLALLTAFQSPAAGTAVGFDQHFTGATLRVGLHHAGTADEERLSIDHLRIEGPWAGPRARPLDPTGFGKFRVELRDLESQTLLYSRGFASIYGEWETTAEAKQRFRVFEESLRLPEPRRSAQLAIQKRGADDTFRELFVQAIDPRSRIVDRAPCAARGEVIPLFEEVDPARAVDLLVVADGYAAAQREKFVGDSRRLVEVMFKTEPFQRRRADFNVRLLFTASPEAGISNPRKGVWKDSALGCSFNAFDSDRYVLTQRDFELREIASQAPYDTLILLFNEKKYGGGGIYNLWATCAADTEPAPYVFVHEFGHSFAGLADEYYSSQVAYEDFVAPGVEPWEPNVTALLDPSKLKWKDLVESSTPLPTPWDKPRFDALDLSYQAKRAELLAAGAGEDTMEALFREVKASTGPLLAAEKFAGKVGAFEGACYQAKGLYRPSADCIMFTRNPTSFCRVCERALERTIDSYVK
ncbi:MAG: peptidase M64 [Planctomycetes bacterium]|nr:peptidase M64 [Planctomycetota bacterium]